MKGIWHKQDKNYFFPCIYKYIKSWKHIYLVKATEFETFIDFIQKYAHVIFISYFQHFSDKSEKSPKDTNSPATKFRKQSQTDKNDIEGDLGHEDFYLCTVQSVRGRL